MADLQTAAPEPAVSKSEPGALHLTRQQDLLELELPAPDLSIYDSQDQPDAPAQL